MTKPRIFVTRRIPQKGLDLVRQLETEYDVEVWPHPLPPAYDVLTQKVRGVTGLLCLLTDQMYILRFRELLAHVPDPAVQDVELLRIGRHHYRGNDRIILGRNEQENAVLAEHADPQQHLLIVPDFPGPSALCIPAPDSTTARAELADTAMSLIRERSRKRNTPVASAPIRAGGDS